jgi:hypothetical protein
MFRCQAFTQRHAEGAQGDVDRSGLQRSCDSSWSERNSFYGGIIREHGHHYIVLTSFRNRTPQNGAVTEQSFCAGHGPIVEPQTMACANQALCDSRSHLS